MMNGIADFQREIGAGGMALPTQEPMDEMAVGELLMSRLRMANPNPYQEGGHGTLEHETLMWPESGRMPRLGDMGMADPSMGGGEDKLAMRDAILERMAGQAADSAAYQRKAMG